jgi:hypothetical protein
MTRAWIGIDDTDNLESRGTGNMARRLIAQLELHQLAEGLGVTRHQLLVSPEIPYTSHNSSACLQVETADLDGVWLTCRDFLTAESAPGSDAGLCLAVLEQVDGEVQRFGRAAKQEVLTMQAAHELAARKGLRLEGLVGTRGGVIGSLAAVGLCVEGNDGRFLWMPGLRELSGTFTAQELIRQTRIQAVRTLDGHDILDDRPVEIGDWPRPVLQDGLSILFVEEVENGWRCVDKETIKRLTE